MSSWKARLLMLLATMAMLIAVSVPAIAQDFDGDGFDDCEFVGFDESGDALFLCEADFDDDFFFFDADFDGIDDDFDDCLGAEIDGECFGIERADFDGDGIGDFDDDDDGIDFDGDDDDDDDDD